MTAHNYSPAFSRNDQSPLAKWFWTVDRGLLAAALTLVALGVSLSFASSPAAILADQSITDPFHYSWRMITRPIEAQTIDRKSTRLNSSHSTLSRMPSSA